MVTEANDMRWGQIAKTYSQHSTLWLQGNQCRKWKKAQAAAAWYDSTHLNSSCHKPNILEYTKNEEHITRAEIKIPETKAYKYYTIWARQKQITVSNEIKKDKNKAISKKELISKKSKNLCKQSTWIAFEIDLIFHEIGVFQKQGIC